MKPPWAVNREAFDRLLEWLGSDRETSAREYERIRSTLIRIFEWRGARNCEELADETFDRAARRLEEGAILEGSNPYPYLHGVAVRVLHDHRQKVSSLAAAILSTPRPVLPSPEWEARLDCLDKALAQLNRRDRQLIQTYYRGQKHDKIDNRRRLAEQMGITVNALRIRVLRIRERLELPIADCMHRRGTMK
jgi:DNA-directed RNA polymerase specialized sigma24 family protein